MWWTQLERFIVSCCWVTLSHFNRRIRWQQLNLTIQHRNIWSTHATLVTQYINKTTVLCRLHNVWITSTDFTINLQQQEGKKGKWPGAQKSQEPGHTKDQFILAISTFIILHLHKILRGNGNILFSKYQNFMLMSGCRGLKCHIVSYFVKIGKTVFHIIIFFHFSRWRCLPSWTLTRKPS